MLKQVYRIIILIAVFIASIWFFGRDIKEVVFDIDNTTVMEDATFPLISLRTGGTRINRLHGYSMNLDTNQIREALVPIGPDQTLEVMINQEAYDIKKLNYELRDFVGNELIEKGSVSVFEEEENEKIAKIKINKELADKKEYAVKLTLITSESRKMYYFHRIKKLKNSFLKENLAFVMEFHEAIKNKETGEEIRKYLETDKNLKENSLAGVNIKSSFDLVTWGNIKPEFLTEIIPTVIENYQDISTVSLSYIVRAEVSDTPEIYEVREFYRVRYSPDRMYLLNYERTMEALFDVRNANITNNELKLGITSDTDIPYKVGPDRKKLAFVRNRELWFYNLEDNVMVRVFSFRQENTDYIRDYYHQHDIRILNMDAEGNIDFLVYGYMNRGQYEGRVAIVLYEYIRAEDRIEEKAYIPVEEPYQKLKENLGDFSYVNALDVFYFHLYNSIYSYDLITRQVNEIAEQVSSEDVAVLDEEGYVAWQENSEPKKADRIQIMNLETGEMQSIEAPSGYKILLLDMIDSNLIYGFVAEKDITTLLDGRTIIPMDRIEISTKDKKVLKDYAKQGYYVTDLKVKDNIIELYRVRKEGGSGRTNYLTAPNDYIMNQIIEKTPPISVISREGDAMAEYYLKMPSEFVMNELPEVKETVSTVISQDPTLWMTWQKTENVCYYPFIAGKASGAYEEAAGAIQAADAGAGVVLDSRNRLIWERGVKASKSMITEFDDIPVTAAEDSLEGCIRLILSNLDIRMTNENFDLNNNSAFDILDQYMEKDPLRLTGISLEQALYYVTMGRPVIAMTDQKNAVLIYGFDTFNINIIDPGQGKAMKVGLQDGTEMFEEAGNVYISYLDQ